MSTGRDLDYAVVSNTGERTAHVAGPVAWRVVHEAGNRRVEVTKPVDALCGWPMGRGAAVLLEWGSCLRCVPCEIVARYRGYTIADDAAKPGAAWRRNE